MASLLGVCYPRAYSARLRHLILVINFVLRDGYSSPLTTASLGHLTRGDLMESDFSQSYAKVGERWRGVAALEYYIRNGVPASDRSQGQGRTLTKRGCFSGRARCVAAILASARIDAECSRLYHDLIVIALSQTLPKRSRPA